MQENLVTRLKHHLKNYKLYLPAAQVRGSARTVNGLDTRFISLKPKVPSRGTVLLSYVIEPFLLREGEGVPNSHTNYWESLQIGKIFLDLGYGVDVVHYNNDTFVPTKDYTFFVGHRRNFARLALLLNQDCVRILHLDMAHWLFTLSAQSRRLLRVQQKKGVTLPIRRAGRPNWAIEHADYATILGNEFTIGTYSYANKAIYPVPISTPVLYHWPEDKAFDAARKRYLWFGSEGLVRKGLDLVLEAFAEMPDYHLTICGPIEKEKDFVRAYRKELFETPNIELVGWVDISSQKFMDICNRCMGLIYASSSEGQCGGVVTCMHAGLIPVISRESGVDVADFGVLLQSCSIEEIKEAIRSVAEFPTSELIRRARAGWEFARAHYTRETFAKRYREVIVEIVTSHSKATNPDESGLFASIPK